MYHGMAQAILATTKKRLEAGYGGSVVDIPAPARNAKLVVVSSQGSDGMWLIIRRLLSNLNIGHSFGDCSFGRLVWEWFGKRMGSEGLLGAQVGDTHGQLADFLWILHRQGLPSERSGTVYLINGDVADRGPNACEIFLLIFALKLLHPTAVYFTRGNHEVDGMNMDDGW